jgi:hypothetical protein
LAASAAGRCKYVDHANGGFYGETTSDDPLDDQAARAHALVRRANARPHTAGRIDVVPHQGVRGASPHQGYFVRIFGDERPCVTVVIPCAFPERSRGRVVTTAVALRFGDVIVVQFPSPIRPPRGSASRSSWTPTLPAWAARYRWITKKPTLEGKRGGVEERGTWSAW